MAVVLQASLGAVASPAKDDSNVQQLKQRIKELEDETDELSRKYNEELKIERVSSTTSAEAKITFTRIVYLAVIESFRF